MPTSAVDLAKLFGAVAQTLMQNRDALNQADTYNHDHGDNMVGIFQTIAQSVQGKKPADAGAALRKASSAVRKSYSSGSAQVYAQSLANAAQRFKKQPVTKDNALDLIQTLLGAQAPAAPRADAAGGDLLGSLLGGLAGGQPAPQTGGAPGIDAGDLLSAGMAFMQAKQSGGSPAEALISTLLSSSSLGATPHRAESGKLVANALLQALGSLAR